MEYTWDLYSQLSLMMFLEFAIWGAWAPVLAARLLGPLKMTGKQTGWIYATLPLACIFSPLIAGQLADEYFASDRIIAVAHVIGAVLLFVAVKQTRFVPLFVTMLLYSTCYAATLPLVNAVMFTHLGKVLSPEEVGAASGWIFLWAPVSWALSGYFLTGWRQVVGESDGRDCLLLAAVLSAVMGLVLFFYVPFTPPAQAGGVPIVKAFSMLSDPNFLIFLAISLVVAGLMQFYFLGTAQFMQDMGIPSKFVPAAMALAQAAQAVATFVLLGVLIAEVGFKWTLALGALSWALMYAVYVAGKPRSLIILSQSLHGIAYVLFLIAGQIYANEVARPEIRSSVQALVFAATTGLGLFIGTQAAGIVMDASSVDGKFNWRKVWGVPGGVMAAGVVALAIWAVAM
ncbi:MAG: nucleoside permease [Rhodopirellula sp.]|nr:nucleoside permease [Rhodopirellula sp.]